MKIVWSSEIDEILRNGSSLDAVGVNNWALQKDEALKALMKLDELGVPVLGGDVCELINGSIQYNYDNWHCDQKTGESKGDFVSRSIIKSREYIENYQGKNQSQIFFALVPGV